MPRSSRADDSRKNDLLVNKDEPRMHTHRHEWGWDSFNDERRLNVSATL